MGGVVDSSCCSFQILDAAGAATPRVRSMLKAPDFQCSLFSGEQIVERILKFRRYIYHDLSGSSAGDHSHCLLRESYVKLPVAIESVKPATEFLLGQ